MKDNPPLLRQWLLIRLLGASGSGLTIHDLADELQVSEKTVRRDLDTLQLAGFPVAETVEEFGRKRWNLSRWQPSDLSFTYDEALALCLAQRFLDPLYGTYFWQAAQKAFQKLRSCFDKKAMRYLSRVGQALHQTSGGANDYTRKAEIIDELLVAIEDSRSVFLTYQSQHATEPVTYDVYPYGLTYHRGSLYLVGYAPRREEVRHWKVDRIDAADQTELQFPRPTSFDLQEHFSGSFGIYGSDTAEPIKIRIRFSREVARYVQESTWHDSQSITPQPDGTLLAEFELTSTVEIQSWVMSFGRHAEVLEPEGLREEMRGDIEAMHNNFARQEKSSERMNRNRGDDRSC